MLELCSGGELFDLIVERGYFTEKEVAIVSRTLLQAGHPLGCPTQS